VLAGSEEMISGVKERMQEGSVSVASAMRQAQLTSDQPPSFMLPATRSGSKMYDEPLCPPSVTAIGGYCNESSCASINCHSIQSVNLRCGTHICRVIDILILSTVDDLHMRQRMLALIV
jgi:hypothetical protein